MQQSFKKGNYFFVLEGKKYEYLNQVRLNYLRLFCPKLLLAGLYYGFSRKPNICLDQLMHTLHDIHDICNN